MSRNFHESFAEKPTTLPSERSTGLVFVGVAMIVAWLWRTNSTILVISLGVAGVLAAISFLAPTLLRPLNVVWFKLGLALNKVVSPLVMLAMFVTVIVPFGLVMQRFYDPLRKRRQPTVKSYWIERDEQVARSNMANQF
jgi:hypothetical protein